MATSEQTAVWAQHALTRLLSATEGAQQVRLDTGTRHRIVTEHAKRMSTGWLVRDHGPDIEKVYPLEQWIADQRADGRRVARRRIIVVEDWTED